MNSRLEAEIPNRIRPRIVLILIVTVIAAIGATYIGAQRFFRAQAISVAASQHALYQRSLNEAIAQHQHLPFILSKNPLIADHVARGTAARLNALLSSFSQASSLEAIYVMSLTGEVVAASNYQQDSSFLGQNYGFRPYFKEAAEGRRGDYFALGATTGRPGYFVAEPLRAATGDVLGVVAIKLDVSELQASWERRGERVLVTNDAGIVVISSNRDWLYHSINALDPTRRQAIVASRQFGGQAIPVLDWQVQGNGRALLENQLHFVASGPTEIVDWTVYYLTDGSDVRAQTLYATSILGAFITGLIAFSVFLRSQRIRAALDLSQRQRHELEAANRRLVTAQEELARSSKLAALGQLSASVTHELGQPISALKNHLFAAEIGQEITSPETLVNLRRLADRMEGITKQLRFFARRGGEEWKNVDMAAVVREALSLMEHDFAASGVEVDWQEPEQPCIVEGNQLQLEQAVVNLLRNAQDAMQNSDSRQVRISCTHERGEVSISVRDTGTGLQNQPLETLKEPFFSTRSSGDGMGLGLAITTEILRAHGGQVHAVDADEGGAIFTITVPASEDPS